MKSSEDIMTLVQKTLELLEREEISVEDARARAGLLKTASKMCDTMVAHAKLTGRFTQGSNVLPGFVMGESAKKVKQG